MGNITTTEELARNFGEEIGREYQEFLDFWRATVRNDREGRKIWEERIRKEVPIVEENALKKILELMKYPKKRKKYLLKKWIFKNKNILIINHKTGFFDNLLPERDIKHCFAVNVEYYIDIKNLSFEKVVFPHRR